MELDFQELFLDDGWNEDLDLQVEHMVTGHRLANFVKVLLAATVVIVDQETSRVPTILRMIEHFKLDKSCLACLHCGVILVSFDAFLLRDVLNVGQIFDRSSTAPSKHT